MENSVFEEYNEVTENTEEGKDLIEKNRGVLVSPMDVPGAADNNDGKRSKPLSIVLTALGAAAMALHLTILIMMLSGATELFGKNMNIVNAVMFVVDLFGISFATVYRSLMGTAVAVLYFVSLGFGIKWFVSSIKAFVRNVRTGLNATVSNKLGLLHTTDCCFKMLGQFFILIVASDLISHNEIGGAAITAMVLGGIMFVARSAVVEICKTQRENVLSIVLTASRSALIYTALCLMVKYLNRTAAREFLYGADAMFNGNVFSIDGGFVSSIYALHDKIIEPLMWMIIAAMFIAVMRIYFGGENGYFYSDKRTRMTLLIFTAVALGLNLVLKCIVVSGSSSYGGFESFTGWLGVVKYTLLPLVLIELVFVFTDIIAPNKSLMQTKTVAEQAPAV